MSDAIFFQGDHLTALSLALDTVALPTERRTVLAGLLVDFPNGRIVATDGTRLFMAALPPADTDPADTDPAAPPLVLSVRNQVTGAQVRRLPKSWRTAILDPEALTLRGGGSGPAGGEFRLEVIPEAYPTTDRIVSPYLAAAGVSSPEAARLVLNPDLLKAWSFGREPCLDIELMLAGTFPALLVTFPHLSIPHLALVMGMSYKPRDPRKIGGTLVPSYPMPPKEAAQL